MKIEVVLPICMCVWLVIGCGHAFIAGAYHSLANHPIKNLDWIETKKRLDKIDAIYTAISRIVLPLSIGFLIGTVLF